MEVDMRSKLDWRPLSVTGVFFVVFAISHACAEERSSRSVDIPVEDAAPASENRGASDQLAIVQQAEQGDLVIDATLAKGISFIPSPLRVIVTAYVFKVNEVVSGNNQEEYVVVRDTGGELPD